MGHARRAPRSTVGLIATAAAISVSFSIGGCAAKPKPMSLKELEAAKIAYLDRAIASQTTVAERLVARWEAEYEAALASGDTTDRVCDILMLSGGGAKGAFGAGFLVGWGEVTDPAFQRPQFDIVAGVSTGSLIAPMAFVGDQDSYALADAIYRSPEADWVRERSILDVLLNEESLFTNDGLFRTIVESIGPRIPAIAAQARVHRSLLIGTTNVSQGDSQTWDMTALACDVEAGALTEEEFCRHLLASASIPVAFPPQTIDGNVYVDGSTTYDVVYLGPLKSGIAPLGTWSRQHPAAKPPKIRLWVIANTPLICGPEENDSKLMAIAGRSLDLGGGAALVSELKNMQLESQLLRDTQGRDIEFRFVAMPNGWTSKGKGMFNKDDMDAMSTMGRAMGRDPSSWQSIVPDPLSLQQLRLEMQRQLQQQESAIGVR